MKKLSMLLAIACLSLCHLQAADPLNIDIPRIMVPPTLDDFTGMKPGLTVEGKMKMVSDFVQRHPYDGEAPSFLTQVYIAYDDENLYAVFLAFDDEPDKIRARTSPREKVIQDDQVNLMLDTVNDSRRSYTFVSTARGIQWDGLWTEGKGFDESYDALWHSEGRINDKGYMVRIAVPLSTLRFVPGEPQTWRVLFNRSIPRLNEESFWPAYSLNIQGRLNQAATMTGISGVEPGRNIHLNPYVFARNYHILDPDKASFDDEDLDVEVGLDGKFVIHDTFVLDVTANPDFSQVESDEPQVTVNQRFEVSFPERRPFFLENADFFKTFTSLVFTRRIVDPNGGLRFTGKQNGWSIGAMLIDDEAAGGRVAEDHPASGEAAEIGIVRLNRDVFNQSTLGMIYTRRNFGDDSNQVMGVDGRLRFDDHWLSEFQVAHSDTKRAGESTDGNSYNLMVNRDGRHLSIHNHFLHTDPHFATQLGFLTGEQRPGSKNIHTQVDYTARPESGKLIAVTGGSRVGRALDTSNDSLDTFYRPHIVFEWNNNMAVEFEYSYNRQRLTANDFSQLSQDITLDDRIWEVRFEGEISGALQYGMEAQIGTNINFEPAENSAPVEADRLSWEVNLTWRPISPLQVDINYLYFNLDDQNGQGSIFTNSIARMHANYQFTRSWSLRFISQLEDTDPNAELTSLERHRAWNTDMLVRYVVNPWTALYLGYNNNESNFQLVDGEYGRELVLTDGDLGNDGRQFFLKFSYLFQY